MDSDRKIFLVWYMLKKISSTDRDYAGDDNDFKL